MTSEKRQKPDRVMVDIETLGINPGAVIVSIGAVTFDGDKHETFYQSVSVQSATNAGLTVDGDTLEWWLGQDGDATEQLTGGQPLGRALADFNAFVRGADELWANSPSFDLRIIEAAMDAVGIEPEWEFYQERDFRTLKNLPGRPDLPRGDDEHHAMADAYHQAEVAEHMLSTYGELIDE